MGYLRLRPRRTQAYLRLRPRRSQAYLRLRPWGSHLRFELKMASCAPSALAFEICIEYRKRVLFWMMH